jgi:hypothetical protein
MVMPVKISAKLLASFLMTSVATNQRPARCIPLWTHAPGLKHGASIASKAAFASRGGCARLTPPRSSTQSVADQLDREPDALLKGRAGGTTP